MGETDARSANPGPISHRLCNLSWRRVRLLQLLHNRDNLRDDAPEYDAVEVDILDPAAVESALRRPRRRPPQLATWKHTMSDVAARPVRRGRRAGTAIAFRTQSPLFLWGAARHLSSHRR